MPNITPNATDLATTVRQLRGKIVQMAHRAGTPHLGSSLSCVDILVAAYWGAAAIAPQHPDAPDRDRVILSKGHAASALYAALAYRGFFPKELLDTYADAGGKLAEHPGPHCVPGVEWATGSLGHGLSVALGMALAGRIQGRRYRLFVVMSDGECEEGSVWEAAMFAPIHKLDNVTVIIDYNKWQATGRTNEVMAIEPLRLKWEAFGWDACEVDGHDIGALLAAMRGVPAGKPRALIAHTVKGKGVSFMEEDNNWHYRIPNADEVRRALKELGLA